MANSISTTPSSGKPRDIFNERITVLGVIALQLVDELNQLSTQVTSPAGHTNAVDAVSFFKERHERTLQQLIEGIMLLSHTAHPPTHSPASRATVLSPAQAVSQLTRSRTGRDSPSRAVPSQSSPGSARQYSTTQSRALATGTSPALLAMTPVAYADGGDHAGQVPHSTASRGGRSAHVSPSVAVSATSASSPPSSGQSQRSHNHHHQQQQQEQQQRQPQWSEGQIERPKLSASLQQQLLEAATRRQATRHQSQQQQHQQQHQQPRRSLASAAATGCPNCGEQVASEVFSLHLRKCYSPSPRLDASDGDDDLQVTDDSDEEVSRTAPSAGATSIPSAGGHIVSAAVSATSATVIAAGGPGSVEHGGSGTTTVGAPSSQLQSNAAIDQERDSTIAATAVPVVMTTLTAAILKPAQSSSPKQPSAVSPAASAVSDDPEVAAMALRQEQLRKLRLLKQRQEKIQQQQRELQAALSSDVSSDEGGMNSTGSPQHQQHLSPSQTSDAYHQQQAQQQTPVSAVRSRSRTGTRTARRDRAITFFAGPSVPARVAAYTERVHEITASTRTPSAGELRAASLPAQRTDLASLARARASSKFGQTSPLQQTRTRNRTLSRAVSQPAERPIVPFVGPVITAGTLRGEQSHVLTAEAVRSRSESKQRRTT
eukprot:TRINITY_DN11936_c0_g1_i1.p1 TRINITY_DN11936_c0_g1~~TRINITY_DN11936_c0_g1_i1.p1  ORF type:complete len:658 (-),score=155.35 TRINITY_DN11936_c0_g1_i1:601-2574(-)